jgi:hypothetical protein
VLQGTSLVLFVIATLSTDVRIVDATPVSWSTDNPGVGSIDDRGRLTAHAPGTVIVSATHQGVTGTLKIRVPQLTTNGHVMVAVTPDPVRGSSGDCPAGLDRSTPTWTFTLTITETQGVGFRLEAETFNLYNDDGRILPSGTEPADDRFAPYSMFVEEVCTSLFGSPSGSTELIFTGIDDTGSQFTTGKRVQLLPVAGASTSSRMLPTTMASSATRSTNPPRSRRFRDAPAFKPPVALTRQGLK